MRHLPLLAALSLALLAVGCGARPTRDEARAASIERAFVGRFAGTLEDRGPSSDQRVTRPVRLIGEALDEGGVELTFEHDAGGGRIERSVSRLRVDPATRTMTWTSDGERVVETHAVELFASFTGMGELIVNGRSAESDQPVDVRTVYSLAMGRITWQRDTRPAGGSFAFRYRYTLNRQRR